jgi:uncharacterized protein with PIN domain
MASSATAGDAASSQPRFAMDASLYRFAKQLRLLGCDVLCAEGTRLGSLVATAAREGRVLVAAIGRLVPMAAQARFELIADLTGGKATAMARAAMPQERAPAARRTVGNAARVAHPSRRKPHAPGAAGYDDGDDDDSECDASDDDGGGHDETSDDDDESDDASESSDEEGTGAVADDAILGAASFLEAPPPPPPPPFDARKFHWHVDETTKRSRLRRLVGYDSDGCSEYEFDDRATPPRQIGASHLARQQTPPRVAELPVAAPAARAPLPPPPPPPPPPRDRFVVLDIHANFRAQLAALVRVTGVALRSDLLFSRCVRCNSLIVDVPNKEDVRGLVAEGIFALYQRFYTCPTCHAVFWGVDGDRATALNCKSARTGEFLHSLFPSDGAVAIAAGAAAASASAPHPTPPNCGMLTRHIFSLPRRVKVHIFAFMDRADLDALAAAIPMFNELVTRVNSGGDMRFVRDMKGKARRGIGARAPLRP